MLKICVDTSYLITFADPSRPNHSVALDYFRHCRVSSILLKDGFRPDELKDPDKKTLGI